jgi:hypothetical protein
VSRTDPSRVVSRTHPCPIGLVAPPTTAALVVDDAWCFDHWEDRLRSLPLDMPESAWPPPGWTLYRDTVREIAYAPFDWTNADAKVALVGITPGRHQAWAASMAAAQALSEGATANDALERAKSTGSFSGPMRRNLVSMLDGIGLAELLGIASCDELFGRSAHLATHLSALAFPVFVEGRNYAGSGITEDPVYVCLIEQVLAAQLTQAPGALVIPLGRAAAAAVELLVEQGTVDPVRCLFGFPHPSGANGHRQMQFDARQADMAHALRAWHGTRAA